MCINQSHRCPILIRLVPLEDVTVLVAAPAICSVHAASTSSLAMIRLSTNSHLASDAGHTDLRRGGAKPYLEARPPRQATPELHKRTAHLVLHGGLALLVMSVAGPAREEATARGPRGGGGGVVMGSASKRHDGCWEKMNHVRWIESGKGAGFGLCIIFLLVV